MLRLARTSAGDGRGGVTVRVARRVYVGNLSYKTSWQDLKDFFRETGNVVFSDVMREADGKKSKGCGIVEFETAEEAAAAINTMNDQELDGRQIFVREDREDRDLIGYNNNDHLTGGRGGRGGMGRRVHPFETTHKARGGRVGNSVKRSRGALGMPGGGGGSAGLVVGRRVYVSNLPWSVTWQELKDHFRGAGSVRYADVMRDGERSKGCGIVEYDSPAEALHAISTLSNSTLDGRVITVREDREDRDLY